MADKLRYVQHWVDKREDCGLEYLEAMRQKERAREERSRWRSGLQSTVA
jgi:hypothetical protein